MMKQQKQNLIWKDFSETKSILENTQAKKRLYKTIFISILISIIQYLLINLFSDRKLELSQMTLIACAKKNIVKGETISSELITYTKIPSENYTEDYVTPSQFSSVNGGVLSSNLMKNSPILKNMLLNKFYEKNISHKIPPGKRLFILNTQLGELSYILKVGDKVDIISHMNIPDIGNITEIILEHLSIQAIGSHYNSKKGDKDIKNSVSFYLSPEQVKIISFMENYSKFSLILRNPNDDKRQSSEALTFDRFLQKSKLNQLITKQNFTIIKGRPDELKRASHD